MLPGHNHSPRGRPQQGGSALLTKKKWATSVFKAHRYQFTPPTQKNPRRKYKTLMGKKAMNTTLVHTRARVRRRRPRARRTEIAYSRRS